MEPESRDAPVLEINALYDAITMQLEEKFGQRHAFWVRGEIAKVFEKNHAYIDLVDANARDAKPATLGTHCWQSKWRELKTRLASQGVALKPGMVVNFKGYVDVYAPQGRIGFTVTDVDVEGLLGDVAKRRAELIARLTADGALAKNKASALGPVPLRVGLVASAGTEGFHDFTGQLLRSNYSFVVSHVQTLVQGDLAPEQIAAAIRQLDGADVDLIALVRGGGSKTDLACFDDERVVRAIAACRTPVFTGIGHTGDESIADLAAHTRAITPTKLGEEIVALVDGWHERHVVTPARALLGYGEDRLERATSMLGERRRTVVFAVRDRLRGEARHLESLRSRLVVQSRHVLDLATNHVATTRALLGAYDPVRRLRQGWSITTNDAGRVVTSWRDVTEGERLHVRLADGTLTTTVQERKEES